MGPPTPPYNITESDYWILEEGETDCNTWCPPDSGCKDATINGRKTKACFCTHDGTTLMHRVVQCQRKVVGNGANKTSSIPQSNINVNIGTTTSKNYTNEKKPVSQVSYQELSHPVTLVVSVLVVFSLVSILLGAICYLKRKSLKRLVQQKNHGSSMDLKTYTPGRLLPDRFINNPTYEQSNVLTELSIPIYAPDDIKILTQIGQGCYGKVFKAFLCMGNMANGNQQFSGHLRKAPH